MGRNYWILLSFLLGIITKQSLGFNIDTSNYVHHRVTGLMFGYSLAFYNSSEPKLLIGAPYSLKFPTENETIGKVYVCDIKDFKLNCNPISDELYDNSLGLLQSFGATVVTNLQSDMFAICTTTHNKNINSRIEIGTRQYQQSIPYFFGTCYVSTNFTELIMITPQHKNPPLHYFNYGSCEGGFSATISKINNSVIMGAPGCFNWHGQVYTFESPNLKSNKEYNGTSSQENGYMGYSSVTITVKNFTNLLEEDHLAIGIPRYNYIGRVSINDIAMNNICNIEGVVIGEYFGYSLATLDVNGDGLKDLVISAPMFTDTDQPASNYETGRVSFLLQQRPDETKTRWGSDLIHIYGKNSKGRFGIAIASLGDINDDKYEDFAVSAPYAGANNKGAVYIFHGSEMGPEHEPCQVIQSEDIKGFQPNTFGFSLAGGLDMDGNTYPDLAVGAYNSSMVFIFKTRPVVKVKTMMEFSNKAIDLNDKTCTTSNQNVSCTKLTTCWTYNGRNLPNSLVFEMSWTLDVTQLQNPRLAFLNEMTNKKVILLTLKKEQERCEILTVNVQNHIRDKRSKFLVESTYNLSNKSDSMESKPILQPQDKIEAKLDILKSCGKKPCVPDLQLEVNTTGKYYRGSEKPINISVRVSNKKQAAYDAMFYMTMPTGLHFKTITMPEHEEYKIVCNRSLNILNCPIGNPMRSQDVTEFTIVLEVDDEASKASLSYDLYMNTNSSDPESETTLLDNVVNKTIEIVNDVSSISFYSAPTQDIGPQINHTYTIFNNGSTAIDKLIFVIHYPFENQNGDKLMKISNKSINDMQCQENETLSINNFNEADQQLFNKLNTTEKFICKIQKCHVLVCTKTNFYKNQIVDLTFEWQLESPHHTQLLAVIDVNVISYGNITKNVFEIPLEFKIYEEASTFLPIFVAVIVGIIIYLVICYILLKNRFFVRKRPAKALKLSLNDQELINARNNIID